MDPEIDVATEALSETRAAIEAILFTVEEPIGVGALAEVLERPREEVASLLARLSAEYERAGRGLAIREVAGGWRMYTAPRAYDYLERFVLSDRSGRLSQAALETLAVVAYKQPISRQEISDIRGVNADAAVRSLAQRGFVEEVGRDQGPGQAILYGTTDRFLEQLGLNSLAELPPLTDFLPEDGAPDEPALDELATVRKRLAAASGRRADDDEDAGAVDDELPSAAEHREARRDQDREMDDLTASLERAAKSAMATLREAVAATEEGEEDEEDAPSDGAEPAGGG